MSISLTYLVTNLSLWHLVIDACCCHQWFKKGWNRVVAMLTGTVKSYNPHKGSLAGNQGLGSRGGCRAWCWCVVVVVVVGGGLVAVMTTTIITYYNCNYRYYHYHYIYYFFKLLSPYFVWLCTTVDGQWNQTPAVLLSPSHPQISMLPSGCALGAGGQKNQTLNAESNIEFWGLGFYLVGACRVWFFCPSTVVSSLYTIIFIYSCSVGGGGEGGGQGRGRWRRWRRWQ